MGSCIGRAHAHACSAQNPPVAVFCDMDGSTLCDARDGKPSMITPRTIESFQRYRDSGGIIVFTTGRNIDSLMEKCESASFWPEFCIGTNGTSLRRHTAAPPHPYLDERMSPGYSMNFHIDGKQAASFLQQFLATIPGLNAYVEFPNDQATAHDAAGLQELFREFKPGFELEYPSRQADPNLVHEVEAKEQIPSLCVWVRGVGAKEMESKLVEACTTAEQKQQLRASYIIIPLGLNNADGTEVVMLSDKRSGKAGTLEWLCTKMMDGDGNPVTTASVAAFGDGNNDVEMFKVAGWSCAPANAEDEAQAAASEVSKLSNNDEPVNFIAAQLDAWTSDSRL